MISCIWLISFVACGMTSGLRHLSRSMSSTNLRSSRVPRACQSTPSRAARCHEAHALAAILEEVVLSGIHIRTDAYGQFFARVRRGDGARPIAFVAHTDHPAFEIVSARGHEGIARPLGGFRGERLSFENS